MKTLLRRAPGAFEQGFASIRRELDVPTSFSPDVLAEAEGAQPAMGNRIDARHLRFVAVDPAGATDLDQAFAAERRGRGFRLFYAIADVGTYLVPGGAIDLEARKRGTTLYSPDLRTPLHPQVLSEDRASLLPGSDRPSLMWTIDLDEDGTAVDARLERATVRIAEAISYVEGQRRADLDPEGTTPMGLLRTIGRLRERREVERGGVSLNLPAQEVIGSDGNYALAYDHSLPIEGWNAQISLLTGMVAGAAMGDAKVGILRTLPATSNQDLRQLRRQARCLGVDWPDDQPYAEMIRTIEPDTPARNAFLLQAARSFRGAGYLAFNGELPDEHEHGAIASIYGHVTAPLRRLVDRFANEILLSIYADEAPPSWAVEALEELPSHMGRARSRESALERQIIDYTEAMILEPSIGEAFRGFVVDLDERRGSARVQIAEPAIVTDVTAEGRSLAEEVTMVLRAADPVGRTIAFDIVDDV